MQSSTNNTINDFSKMQNILPFKVVTLDTKWAVKNGFLMKMTFLKKLFHKKLEYKDKDFYIAPELIFSQ